MPTEFEMNFRGSTGNLLSALSVLADHAINMNTVATSRLGDGFVVRFLVGSEEEVRRSFMKADLHFNERKVLVVEMRNQPGQWLRVAKAIVDSGSEIERSYLLGQKGDRMSFVFAVSDYEKARGVCSRLGECSVD